MLSLSLVPSPRINHAIDRVRDHLDILVGRNWDQQLALIQINSDS